MAGWLSTQRGESVRLVQKSAYIMIISIESTRERVPTSIVGEHPIYIRPAMMEEKQLNQLENAFE